MKKIIAFLLTIAMLCTSVSVLSATSAAEQEYTTETFEGEIIIPVSEMIGEWTASTAIKNYDGGAHMWAGADASLIFNVPQLDAGFYEVYYWVCPNKYNAETMDFVVNHNGKTSNLSVHQKIGASETVDPGWVSMGGLSFSGDGTEKLTATFQNGNGRATAVKLVPCGAQFVVTGNALLQNSQVQNKLVGSASTFKLGHHFGTASGGRFSVDTVDVKINVPYTGDYYVYADVRTYDVGTNGGSDTNRSIAISVTQKGKTKIVSKQNSSEAFWFGSFQGQADSFVTNVNSGTCFKSPHTIHLEKGEATLTFSTQNSWVGVSFVGFAEADSTFAKNIEKYAIDTSSNPFYAENNLKIYYIGSTSSTFYTQNVIPFADRTAPEASTVSGVYDDEAKGAMISLSDASADVLGYHIRCGENYMGYFAKENANSIAVPYNPEQIAVYAMDNMGNISSASTGGNYTETELPFESTTIENQNVLPQTFYYNTKDDSNLLINKMTVQSGETKALFAPPIAGKAASEMTTFFWTDGLKPLRDKHTYGTVYTPESARYDYVVQSINCPFDSNHPENAGKFQASSLAGAYKSYYGAEPAVFDVHIPLSGNYILKYFVPYHSDGAAVYQWTINEFSGTHDGIANQGLVELGTVQLTKGKHRFVVERVQGYVRPAMVILEPLFEKGDNTTEVYGMDGFAQKAHPDLSIIGTESFSFSCNYEGGNLVWMLDVADLMQLKTEFPNGELLLNMGDVQIKVPYGAMDLQTVFNNLSDGTNPVYLKVFMKNESAEDALYGIKISAYYQCGTAYVTGTQGLMVACTGKLDKTAIFATCVNGQWEAVPTERIAVSNDRTFKIQTEITENELIFAPFEELPAFKAWDGNESPIPLKDFANALYAVAGKPFRSADDSDATLQKSCLYVADALEYSGKRVVSLSDPETFLADMYPDASDIFVDYVDAVFKTVESGVLRGNGVDNLNPKQILTYDKAYDMICAFIGLPEFVSIIKDAPEKWELVFSDEFNGTEINTDVWELAKGTYSTHIASLRSADDQMVEDGYLKLLIHKGEWERTQNGVTYSGNWNSGHMWTKKDVFYPRYGYYEASYRYPKGNTKYCNNSFWLCSIGGPYLELDINEGRMPSKLAASIHWNHYYDEDGNLIPVEGGRTSSGEAYYVNEHLSDDFHRYSLYWDTDKLIWYFDGVPYREFELEGRGDFNVSVYFSVAIMQINKGQGIISPSDFEAYNEEFGELDGQSMDVEYVRVYQLKDGM